MLAHYRYHATKVQLLQKKLEKSILLDAINTNMNLLFLNIVQKEDIIRITKEICNREALPDASTVNQLGKSHQSIDKLEVKHEDMAPSASSDYVRPKFCKICLAGCSSRSLSTSKPIAGSQLFEGNQSFKIEILIGGDG